MTIPKYITEILSRARFAYGKKATIGYTIMIDKRTPYAKVNTLYADSFKLIKWANAQYQKVSKDDTQIAFIEYVPEFTHYTNQYAIVTIFDPVMLRIEHLIEF